jgi:hypothetical protein
MTKLLVKYVLHFQIPKQSIKLKANLQDTKYT